MKTNALWMLLLVVVRGASLGAANVKHGRNGSRYGFYRKIGGGSVGMWPLSTRRVFGGSAAPLARFPAAVALLDRYWSMHCSGALLAPRWALTAAHCVSPRVAYVKYNSRRPSASDGDVATVHYLYRHPGYKVVQEDEGRGIDVTVLHHDIGLVRTRTDCVLTVKPTQDVLRAMRIYNPVDLKYEEVEVVGFGRTERSLLGEELFTVRLQLVFCERGSWFHCVCGVAGRDPRGVCSGDSGGPVLYHGTQVGVTSMGPLECSHVRTNSFVDAVRSDDAPLPIVSEGATSVFTALYNYAGLVNATINDADAALRMRIISSGPRACAALPTLTVVTVATLAQCGA